MVYFSRNEFECKCGCGFNTVDYELANILDNLRSHFGSPVIVTSGCRCEEHNAKVGGSKHSQHLLGRAADIIVYDVDPEMVYDYLNDLYDYKYGVGLYSKWVHVDSRNIKARWKE